MSSATLPSTPASPASPSLRPALVVIAVAVVIVLGGSALALAGSGSARPSASHGPARKVPGSKLEAQPAAGVISKIASGGEPPSDVTSSLAVPAGSTFVSDKNDSAGVGQFDKTVVISVDAPESEVRAFYIHLLSEEKWVSQSLTSPSPGESEIIAERNATDGYQWGVGIVAKPVRTVVSPALGGGSGAARTTVSMELYQVQDAS